MQSKKFKRTKEDFICKNCGFFVSGDGYTNHCPKCLWSRHVDINPGDRSQSCRGMMEPIRVELRKGRYFILHHCLECGFERFNSFGDNDDFSELLKVSKKK